MIKNHYLQEIKLNTLLSLGSNGPEVKKVQEWLNLRKHTDLAWNYSITVDGDFGPQTDRVVRIFQQVTGLAVDGVVGPLTFNKLVAPMVNAFARILGADLRALIVAYAEQHLANKPRELYNSNSGPWVRAYMDGHEGKAWAWCMGFVQTILDQAFFSLGQDFTAIMPRTYSCDVVGEHGTQKNTLVPCAAVRPDPAFIKPGDVFLVNRVPGDWTHTGIVTTRAGSMIHTIEGNTNDEGAREGFEVCRRVRNLDRQQLDIFRVN